MPSLFYWLWRQYVLLALALLFFDQLWPRLLCSFWAEFFLFALASACFVGGLSMFYWLWPYLVLLVVVAYCFLSSGSGLFCRLPSACFIGSVPGLFY